MTALFRGLKSLLIFALVIGAGVAFVSWTSGRRTTEAPDSSKSAPAAPVPVTANPVVFRPIQQTVETVGTLHGFEQISVAAKVDGLVQKVLHDMADRVQPGEALLEVEPVDFQLALERAQTALAIDLSKLGLAAFDPRADVEKIPAVIQACTRLNNVKSQLDRAESLAAQRVVAQEQLDNARADYRVATAEYENQVQIARSLLVTLQERKLAIAVAQQKLNDAIVRTPVPSRPVPGIDGPLTYAITCRKVAEGSYIRAGTELFKLVIDRPLKLLVPVPERFAGQVQPGQQVSLQVAANGRPVAATVSRVNPAVDPATRTFEVEILVPNAQGELKSGAFAKASIMTRQNPRAATVPLEALVSFAGVTKVFLVVRDRARAVPVNLGLQTADWVEIVDPPIPSGSTVITSGQSAVLDGVALAVRSGLEVAKREVRR